MLLLGLELDTSNAKSIPTELGGGIVRLPSRFLNAGDEWFKQINYRAKLRAISIRKGKEANLKGKELQKRT